MFEATLAVRQPLTCRLLTSAIGRGALANAYLLVGRCPEDKWLLARGLACLLNCAYGTESSCACLHVNRVPSADGTAAMCQSCKWILAGEHPQAFLVLKGDGESGKVPVERARNLVAELTRTSRYFRVVVIPESDQSCFHAAPANALLKTMEEPGGNTVFMLFAGAAEAVLPTIVSRSQILPVSSTRTESLWLSPDAAEDRKRLLDCRDELAALVATQLSARLKPAEHERVDDCQAVSGAVIGLIESGMDPEDAIDLFLSANFEVLKQSSVADGKTSRYLAGVARACEDAKQQISHYVKPAHAVESLAYSLWQLRWDHWRELSLADV